MLRYLLIALGAAATVLFATPTPSSAATVSCGRVTTFVAPDSAGALTSGDGWMILAKTDGSSEKIIIRSGRLTSTGSIGGYVCVSVDGLYFNGVLAPGTAGYIPEPFGRLPSTSTPLDKCGKVTAYDFVVSPNNAGTLTVDGVRFVVGLPGGFRRSDIPPLTVPFASVRLDQTVCVRGLVDPLPGGWHLLSGEVVIVSGLPATSTAGASTDRMQVLITMAVALVAALSFYGARRARASH